MRIVVGAGVTGPSVSWAAHRLGHHASATGRIPRRDHALASSPLDGRPDL